MNNGISKYTSDLMRTYGAGVVTCKEKNATYTIHLFGFWKASLLKHQQRACLYYCLHTYLCAEVEEGEKGRRWRRKDSLELVITESITRSYLQGVACVSFLLLSTLSCSFANYGGNGRRRQRERDRGKDITSRYDRKFTGLLEIYGVDDDR